MSVDEGVTRLDRDKKLKIAQKQSSGMGRRPGTAAATGARQRSGEEEGGGVGGVESRRAEVQWEDSV